MSSHVPTFLGSFLLKYLPQSQFLFRVYDLTFFDETAKIEAHESEVLCVEFSPTDSGMEWKLVISFKG